MDDRIHETNDEHKAWERLPKHIRSAVLRELHNDLARHFVAMQASVTTAREVTGDPQGSEFSFSDRVALHSSEMIAGYDAAIRALLLDD